jgi:hypothetical protein
MTEEEIENTKRLRFSSSDTNNINVKIMLLCERATGLTPEDNDVMQTDYFHMLKGHFIKLNKCKRNIHIFNLLHNLIIYKLTKDFIDVNIEYHYYYELSVSIPGMSKISSDSKISLCVLISNFANSKIKYVGISNNSYVEIITYMIREYPYVDDDEDKITGILTDHVKKYINKKAKAVVSLNRIEMEEFYELIEFVLF